MVCQSWCGPRIVGTGNLEKVELEGEETVGSEGDVGDVQVAAWTRAGWPRR